MGTPVNFLLSASRIARTHILVLIPQARMMHHPRIASYRAKSPKRTNPRHAHHLERKKSSPAAINPNPQIARATLPAVVIFGAKNFFMLIFTTILSGLKTNHAPF